MSAAHEDERAVFKAALEITSPTERVDYLRRTCGSDAELLARVEALLRAHEEAGDFLENPPAEQAITLDSSLLIEGPGTRIGHYELLELIGEGGMGLVYLAEQKEPVRRKVVLKVIKPGMDSKQVVARFEAERQALAVLGHPNIAHVFDAGTTETGRPYFVMEYVKGMSITRYCDEHRLNIEQRLRLFEQVCEAVQHAHQKGIIHRDLKPSNILVSVHGDRAVPKIIDFGIAKAITQPLTDKTFVTFQGQLLGTPEYMSPEQVDLATQDIDTRSDIYSLGVVLYELLAGVLPFEEESFARAGLAEIQRTIREQEPASPSIRLTSLGEQAKAIAESRGTQVVPLARRLHRELEWIPLKAMRKDRCRRYRSASEMADDIHNYLTGRPLIAGPETAIYRVQKFVRKHAGSVATVALVALAIVLGLIISMAMYFRAEKMRVQADQARQEEAAARAEAEQARVQAENARAKETTARTEAEQAEQATKQKAEELRRTLYVNSIQLADAKYREGNTMRVRELLASCPNDLRGWEWNRLNYISDQSIMTLNSHGCVFSAVYATDGRRIVSGDYEGAVKIWDAETGKELKVFRGHKGPVQSVALSVDGRHVASGSWDKTVKIWDTESGQEVMTMRGHKDVVWCVAFSPDGRIVASVDPGDVFVRLWDAKTGKELMPLLAHKCGLDCVAFSPDGKHVIAGDNVGDIIFWDTATSQKLSTLHAHDGIIFQIAVKPDGSEIASVGGWDNEVRIWDTKTGTLVVSMTGHEARVNSVAFSQDGKYIVSGGGDNTIRTWSVATGKGLLTLRGHQDTVGTVAFSPDGKRLMSGSDDGTIRFWDSIVDRETVTLAHHQRPITSIAFSPDGRRVASISDDGLVIVWEVESGAELRLFHSRSHYRGAKSITFSPNGKLIGASCARRTVKIWDAGTGQELQTLHASGDGVWDLSFSPDNRYIAAASITRGETWDARGGAVEVWDVAKAEPIVSLPMGRYVTYSISFSPDGKRIASGDSDGSLRIWEALTGQEIMTIKAHEMPIHCIAFSPDGGCIVSASGDCTSKIWDAMKGTEVTTLCGHEDRVISVKFSPDGKRVITGSNDRAAKLWDATKGVELLTFRVQRGADDVTFSPDGKTIAVGTYEGSVVLFESTMPLHGYEPRRNGKVARKIVDDTYRKWGLYYETADESQADNTLDEPVRKLALQIANSFKWEDANKLRKESWEVVRLPDKDIDTYKSALQKAEKANALEPNDPAILSTLGAARYRLRSYEDALRILAWSARMLSDAGEEPNPGNLAFKAMTLQKIGRADEAKNALEQLRKLCKDEQFAEDMDAQGLLAEAEKVLAGEQP